MIQQVEFSLRPLPRGFHLVTNEVMRNLPALPKTGILNLFVRHTSCGLSLNENFDPDVRHDLKGIFERLVPDGDPRYLHQDEGPTDMSAHAKSSMVGVSLTIPITNGRLNLGTWQGIYLGPGPSSPPPADAAGTPPTPTPGRSRSRSRTGPGST